MNQYETYRNYTCEDVIDLIGAYTIGATTPEEARAIEALLPDCPEAAAELAEYVAMSDAMLHMLPMDKEPPADLIGRLHLTDAPAAPQHHTPAPTPNHHAPAPAPNHHAATPQHHAPTPQPQIIQLPAPTPERRTPWVALVGLAAMFAVIVGMNIIWYQLFQGMQAQQAQLNTLLDQQRQMLTNFESQPAPQPPQPLVMTSGNTHHMELQPNTDDATGAMARVIWDSTSLIGTLYVDGLPQTDDQHNYQMWLVQGESEISLGTFSVTEDGVGTLVFQSPVPIGAADVIGISTEPLNGSPQPTTPHLVTGKIET